MIIKQIDIIPVSIPFVEPFEISLGTTYTAENIFIKIYSDNFVGYGESSPFSTILGETQHTQWEVARLLAQAWLHKDFTHIDDRIRDLHSVISDNNGIKSAFDMALYDLNAQAQSIPLYQLLGGSISKILTTDMTVGMSTTNKMVDDARRFVQDGFDAIKVKVGKNPVDDIQRIRQIRQTIGADIHLRIDANQGWSPQEALDTLNKLSSCDVEHCEEPVASWNLKAQAELNANSPIPIMADESLFDHYDAQRLVDFEACAQFNIKLAKSGGLHSALKIIEIAKNHNIHCQVGCFSETRLGITALAHLSIACDQIIHYDMDSPLMLVDDPIIGGIEYHHGKEVKMNDSIGLGASLDEDFIKDAQILTIR